MSKSTTAQYLALDVRFLAGRATWFQVPLSLCRGVGTASEDLPFQVWCNRDSVTLSYVVRSSEPEGKKMSYDVGVEWTPCNYGGARAWSAVRRSAVDVALRCFMEEVFACRHCHQLAYQSQREAAWDRALSQAQGIRVKLALSCRR